MKRLAMFPVSVVHEMVQRDVNSIAIRGIVVRLSSSRLKLFVEKGVACVLCSSVGRYYVAERLKGHPTFSLNLYTECGRLMTRDHIIPRSKGGLDSLDNLQPMCSKCNGIKGDKILA